MKDERFKYFIFRVYSEKERPGISPVDRTVFYGWASAKSVVKAFFGQRDKKKYKVKKLAEDDERMRSIEDNLISFDTLIDFVELKSSETGEKVSLFMTPRELKETEVKLREYFRDLSRLVERDDGRTRLLELYINIDDYYLDPLQYIGFDPPELNDLFPSVEYRESDDYMYSIEGMINSRYEEAYGVPSETYVHTGLIPAFTSMDSVADKIIYSIESFVKIMKDDL